MDFFSSFSSFFQPPTFLFLFGTENAVGGAWVFGCVCHLVYLSSSTFFLPILLLSSTISLFLFCLSSLALTFWISFQTLLLSLPTESMVSVSISEVLSLSSVSNCWAQLEVNELAVSPRSVAWVISSVALPDGWISKFLCNFISFVCLWVLCLHFLGSLFYLV